MEAARQVGVQDSDDWEQLLTLLPQDWRAKCRELNALRRNRGFPSADALLRVLMIHLLEGRSLRDTAIRAREGKIAAVSDVALLKRLHACGEWFRWLALACRVQDPLQTTLPSSSRRVVLLDATHVKEPGVTGARWREFSWVLQVIRYIVSPKLDWGNFVSRWGQIVRGLRKPPRKRLYQLDRCNIIS